MKIIPTDNIVTTPPATSIMIYSYDSMISPCALASDEVREYLKVEILGMGCWKCKALEEMVREIVKDLGLDAEVTKVTDINKIVEYGVVMTPGLVINGKVRASGRLPSRDDVENYLKSASN